MIQLLSTLLNSNFILRLLNKNTAKSLPYLIVSIPLMYMGASDDVLIKLMEYQWLIPDIFLNVYFIGIVSLVLLLIGGYYLFSHTYPQYRILELKNKLDEEKIDLELIKIDLEKKKLLSEFDKIK